jgi:polyisoprenoid-binding protein YceI
MILPLLVAVAQAAPVTYALQPEKSWLYVVTYYDRERITPITAHDHVERASTFTGNVTWDPEDPSSCAIHIELPVASLVIDPPGARERENLDPSGAVDEGTKVTIVKNMLSPMNLDAENHRTISYQSVSCAARPDGRIEVAGDLTIRGVTKRVTTPMVIRPGEGTLAAGGVFKLTHADFGMKPFTYGLMTPKNKEEIKFVIDVVGETATPSSYVPPAG